MLTSEAYQPGNLPGITLFLLREKDTPNLGRGFALRCFQRLSFPNIATRHSLGSKADRPEVRSTRSSRTRVDFPQVLTPATDRDQPVSRRFEPSSRALLSGEQPHAWDLLQPRARASRHRGAEPCRR